MTNRDDNRCDALIVDALRRGRKDAPELGPARLELERRRLLARIGEEGTGPRAFVLSRPARAVRFAAIAAAAMVALAASAFFLATRGGDPTVTLAGEWRLEPGDAISTGAWIRVPDGARASLTLADGSRIWADGGTRLRLATDDVATLEVAAGRVAADIAKRPASARPFVLASAFAEVAVLGTVFAVNVDDDGIDVRLYEGRVRVTASGRSVALTPGRSARATSTGIASLGGIPASSERADAALFGGMPVRVAAASLGTEPDSEETLAPPASIDPPSEIDAATPAPAPEAPRDRDGLLRQLPMSGEDRGAPDADPLSRLVALWRAERYDEILALTSAPGTPPEQSFYRGKTLSALGRWSEAAPAFEKASAASGEIGGEALYLAAVSHSRCGAHGESLSFSERAAARGGPNADHARRLVFISLSALGRYSDAARSASDYLAAFPEGAHVAEARFVLSTGLRLARRWADASTGYEGFLALGRGEPQMRDDAAFYVGYCQLMAGAAAEGRSNLERYLGSYPSGRHVEQARAALSN